MICSCGCGEEIITLAEAGQRLHRGKTTLFRAVTHGLIPAERSGRTWLVRAADVEHYRQAHASDRKATRARARHARCKAPVVTPL